MERVITYIDGFNLYFGMKSKFANKYLWLDVEKLSKEILLTDQELVATKYFTSRVRNAPEKEKRQNTYLEALQTVTQTEIFYGNYQNNQIDCKTCGSIWFSPKEKMTDVNIATQILLDAHQNNFDTAIIISGDSDLIPPVKAIKEHFTNKKIGVFFPPDRHSAFLHSVAHFSQIIGKKKLQNSQLPLQIRKPNGYILEKPITWI